MQGLIPSWFWRILDAVLRHWDVVLFVVVGAVLSLGAKLRQSMKRSAGRRWPAVPATIDVVSVVERGEEEKAHFSFVATITYFYRNPELQMGEYERIFPIESAARLWVEQFKQRQVFVHVNPKKPAESVLLDEDLDAITSRPAPSEEEALRAEEVPRLRPAYRVLAAISEMISIAGLAGSVVLLGMSLASGGRFHPSWALSTGGPMLVFVFASQLVVTHSVKGEGSGSFLHAYTLWCPAWMRWAMKISAALLGAAWFVMFIRSELPPDAQQWLQKMSSTMPYVWGCWGFLATAGFHAAVLHSQELAQAGRETFSDLTLMNEPRTVDPSTTTGPLN